MSVVAVARRRLALGVLSLGPWFCTFAHAETPPVTPNSTGVTVAQLLAGLTDPSQAYREGIHLYLLGVFDQTEGTVWCDYGRLKVDTLRDAVYGQLRQLQGVALQQRAAPAVSAVLARQFPCQG